jgi:hypothetical protein
LPVGDEVGWDAVTAPGEHQRLTIAMRRAQHATDEYDVIACRQPESVNAENEGAPARRLNSTKGGSRETEENELAVNPTGTPCAVRVVTTVTPVTNRPIARRNSRGSTFAPRQSRQVSPESGIAARFLLARRHR